MNTSKKTSIFYIFPVLYIASVYLLPIFFFLSDDLHIFSYLVYAPFVFGILNIIVSAKYCKPEYRHIMLNSMVLIKYTMIPFFLLGGILVFSSFLLTFIPVPFMLFLGPAFAVMGLACGWFILAFEAPYSISYLRLSQQAGLRPKSLTILHCVLQFFFFLDVLDVIYLTLKERKWKSVTITLLVLMGIAVILFFILLFIGLIKLIF